MSMRCNTCQVEFPIEKRKKHFFGKQHVIAEIEGEMLRLWDELAIRLPKQKSIIRKLKEETEQMFRYLTADSSKSTVKGSEWEHMYKHKHCCEEA